MRTLGSTSRSQESVQRGKRHPYRRFLRHQNTRSRPIQLFFKQSQKGSSRKLWGILYLSGARTASTPEALPATSTRETLGARRRVTDLVHRVSEKMRSRQFVNRAAFGSPGPSIRVALGFDACHPVCGGKWCPAGHAGQEGGRVELCTLRYGATRA